MKTPNPTPTDNMETTMDMDGSIVGIISPLDGRDDCFQQGQSWVKAYLFRRQSSRVLGLGGGAVMVLGVG